MTPEPDQNSREHEYDLVVIGGGAAGLAAASRGADLDLRVLVLEKANFVGGAAALSGGALWTAASVDALAEVDSNFDRRLAPVIVEGWTQAVEDVRAAGASRGDQALPHLPWGRGHQFDVTTLFNFWSGKVQTNGGSIQTGVSGVGLARDGQRGRWSVTFQHRGMDSVVLAKSVILATGGFQGDPALVQTFLGHGADDMVVRSNGCSVGDGYRLGLDAGAASSRHLSGFYGHTLPAPLPDDTAAWAHLTMWFSMWTIAVSRSGRRFVDESLGDEAVAQALLKQPGHRAALVWDQTVHEERVAMDYPSGRYNHDEVVSIGACTAQADSVGELADAVAAWGFDREPLALTLASNPDRLARAPFRAALIQPSITTPFGGLRIDTAARVLDRDNSPIDGLYAAGADAGGVHAQRYIGGLVVALVLGRLAAETARADAGRPGERQIVHHERQVQ